MGADKKLSQLEARLKIPSTHPTLESYVKCVVAMDELHQHKTALGTSENNRGSKHEKQHKKHHGITHWLIRRI